MPAKDIVVTIDWEKTSTIPYKVEHYLENID
jgi:hypothetical protein